MTDSRALSAMFANCSSLVESPILHLGAVMDNLAYGQLQTMFSGCTSLNKITIAEVSSWGEKGASSWVSGVAANGTFYKPAGTSIPTGISGIPSGWTVVDL